MRAHSHPTRVPFPPPATLILLRPPEQLGTDPLVRLRMITLFRHSHNSDAQAETARAVCLDTLERYPTQEVTLVVIKTLTCLARALPSAVPQQVDWLLQLLNGDPRKAVRHCTLLNLQLLAEASAHLWRPDALAGLVRAVLAMVDFPLRRRGLGVVLALLQCPFASQAVFGPPLLDDIVAGCESAYVPRPLSTRAAATVHTGSSARRPG